MQSDGFTADHIGKDFVSFTHIPYFSTLQVTI